MTHIRIEIFKVLLDFNSPIDDDTDDVIQNCSGDYLFIIDGDVFIENMSDNEPNRYTKVVYSPEFVRMNKKIFEKQ